MKSPSRRRVSRVHRSGDRVEGSGWACVVGWRLLERWVANAPVGAPTVRPVSLASEVFLGWVPEDLRAAVISHLDGPYTRDSESYSSWVLWPFARWAGRGRRQASGSRGLWWSGWWEEEDPASGLLDGVTTAGGAGWPCPCTSTRPVARTPPPREGPPVPPSARAMRGVTLITRPTTGQIRAGTGNR